MIATASPDLFAALRVRQATMTPEIRELILADSPVAIGVSGGKDSCAVAFATVEALDQLGHTGPRILIHSDLGMVEWKDSLPTCERLADALGLELVVVRRAAGGMMERWRTRWKNNVQRYVDLSCVKLILPWSTPSMRFCTSELKTAVICADLVKRFPGQTILSVIGIRADESAGRAKAPIAKPNPRLTNKTHRTTGYDWNAILDWSLHDVLEHLRERDFPLHEAYTRYGASRVSCAFCMMSARGDLVAAAACEDNHGLYREMVALEVESTFAFQSQGWLGDIAPHLLTSDLRDGLAQAKERAAIREAAEARIPEHLLYTKGWPTCIPTLDEASLLASVRRDVAEAVGLTVEHTRPLAILERYEELMEAKLARQAGVRRTA